ncbi:MAG: prolyl oligopeptidase family serine peptidase [Bradymonadales bacterium]|nr:prolyl oligopeptidase family serine peptidase [Bradymonadales bacterium]
MTSGRWSLGTTPLVALLAVWALLIGCGQDPAVGPPVDLDAAVDQETTPADDPLDDQEGDPLEEALPDDLPTFDQADLQELDPEPIDDTGGTDTGALPFLPAGPEAAPDPMAFGPFPVGVATFDLYDESRREWIIGPPRFLRTEVWYPAVPSAREGPFWSYDFHQEVDEQIDLGDKEEEFMAAEIPPLQSMAVRDAELDREHGPYPVILFSHGAYSLRFEYLFYTVHLASHGYIVVAPDHTGNTTWDAIRDGFNVLTMLAAAPDRLEDLSFLLDELAMLASDPRHLLYQAVNLVDVGVTGHSYGGFTAATVPCRDSGFRASVLLAPVMDMVELYGCDLADYPVPVMLMGGTDDQTVSWESQYCGYRSIGHAPKILYQLERGGHFTFSDMCRLGLEEQMIEGAPDIANDGCSPTDNVPYEEAQQTIDHYATAFFNLYLRHSPPSADFLIDYAEPPFEPVTLTHGEVPDWPDGGCSSLPF